MRRQTKYPDTKWFHYHNENPKNRLTGDCAYRAISTAIGMGWEYTVLDMAERSCKTGYAPTDTKGISDYLKERGWHKNPQPKHANGTKYTGTEFCDALNRGIIYPFNHPIVANIGGHHIVCIKKVNGLWKIHDTWDSSYKCIGNFWTLR